MHELSIAEAVLAVAREHAGERRLASVRASPISAARSKPGTARSAASAASAASGATNATNAPSLAT